MKRNSISRNSFDKEIPDSADVPMNSQDVAASLLSSDNMKHFLQDQTEGLSKRSHSFVRTNSSSSCVSSSSSSSSVSSSSDRSLSFSSIKRRLQGKLAKMKNLELYSENLESSSVPNLLLSSQMENRQNLLINFGENTNSLSSFSQMSITNNNPSSSHIDHASQLLESNNQKSRPEISIFTKLEDRESIPSSNVRLLPTSTSPSSNNSRSSSRCSFTDELINTSLAKLETFFPPSSSPINDFSFLRRSSETQEINSYLNLVQGVLTEVSAITHEKQGLLIEHLFAFNVSLIEQQYDSVIMFRPVNPLCKSLLRNNFATKNFSIKGKTSDWGPHAGYIPFEQALAKCKSRAESRKFKQEIINLISQEKIISDLLVLSEERLLELSSLGVIQIEEVNDPNDLWVLKSSHSQFNKEFTFHAVLIKNDIQNEFHDEDLSEKEEKNQHFSEESSSNLSRSGNFRAIYIERKPKILSRFIGITMNQDSSPQFEPLLVLKNSEGKYITADYDLFMVIPTAESYGNSDVPHDPTIGMVTRQSIDKKQALITPTNLAGLYSLNRLLHSIPSEDSNKGNVNFRIRTLLDLLNRSVYKTGFLTEPVVHHGAEQFNPYSESKNVDYPITVMEPIFDSTHRTIVDYKVGLLENKKQLVEYLFLLSSNGYMVRPNPRWKDIPSNPSIMAKKEKGKFNDLESFLEISVGSLSSSSSRKSYNDTSSFFFSEPESPFFPSGSIESNFDSPFSISPFSEVSNNTFFYNDSPHEDSSNEETLKNK